LSSAGEKNDRKKLNDQEILAFSSLRLFEKFNTIQDDTDYSFHTSKNKAEARQGVRGEGKLNFSAFSRAFLEVFRENFPQVMAFTVFELLGKLTLD
jgi:hypothetical protein